MYNGLLVKIISDLISNGEYTKENLPRFKEDIKRMYELENNQLINCLVDFSCAKAEKDYDGNVNLLNIINLFDKLLLTAKNFK